MQDVRLTCLQQTELCDTLEIELRHLNSEYYEEDKRTKSR